jgi:hypothetical protein
MTNNQNKRLVLAGSAQVAGLLKGNPEIAQHVPKLAPLLVDQQRQTSASKGCGCARKSSPAPSAQINSVNTENILSSLTNEDFLKIKNVLGLSELCYYTRNNPSGSLDLICI